MDEETFKMVFENRLRTVVAIADKIALQIYGKARTDLPEPQRRKVWFMALKHARSS